MGAHDTGIRVMALPWWLPFGKVPEVPAPRLAQELVLAPPPQVVDVRTEAEFRRGHVHGAVNVPIQQLAARLPALGLERDRAVVAICLSGHRSIPAVRLLRARGFEASQLRGGMFAWRAAGFPEERG
jgi:rhodanese-related sulfurtransferase